MNSFIDALTLINVKIIETDIKHKAVEEVRGSIRYSKEDVQYRLQSARLERERFYLQKDKEHVEKMLEKSTMAYREKLSNSQEGKDL